VDHEVEDDIDVEGAGSEDAEAVGLEEHGAVEVGLDGGDGGIEAFEVADLKDAAALLGGFDEAVCLVSSGGDRFLDEDVDSLLEELHGHVVVGESRDADRGSVDLEVGFGKLLDGIKGGDPPLFSGGGGELGVGLDDGGEGNGEAGVLEFAIDAEVVASEGAGADDGYAKDGLGWQGAG